MIMILVLVAIRSVACFDLGVPGRTQQAILTAQCRRPKTNAFLSSSSFSWMLEAKPKPSSFFDLDAIEEFESQLQNQPEEPLEADDDESDETASNTREEELKTFVITPQMAGKRIDAVLALLLEPDYSRSFCGILLTGGRVAIVEPTNDDDDDDIPLDPETESHQIAMDSPSRMIVTKKSFKVALGQKLEVRIPPPDLPTDIVAQDIALDILYEDNHMVVLNKAAHMVVHPAAGNWDGTIVNALAFYLKHNTQHGPGDLYQQDHDDKAMDDIAENEPNQSIGGDAGEMVHFRPGIVHRLDKGTTGVLVVAKTATAHAALSAAFAQRQVKKTYMAITVGNPGRNVVIDKPMERHPIHRQRMRVVPDPHKHSSDGFKPLLTPQTGRRALSFVDTLAFDGKLSVVQVRIETGRTHQIRVHLQDRHTPIYGDDVYGLTDWNRRLASTYQIERPLLHAYRLELNHPVTGQHMVFTAPLADDMKRIVQTVYPQSQSEIPELFAEPVVP